MLIATDWLVLLLLFCCYFIRQILGCTVFFPSSSPASMRASCTSSSKVMTLTSVSRPGCWRPSIPCSPTVQCRSPSRQRALRQRRCRSGRASLQQMWEMLCDVFLFGYLSKRVFIRHLHLTRAWSALYKNNEVSKIYTRPRAQWTLLITGTHHSTSFASLPTCTPSKTLNTEKCGECHESSFQ